MLNSELSKPSATTGGFATVTPSISAFVSLSTFGKNSGHTVTFAPPLISPARAAFGFTLVPSAFFISFASNL